MTVIASASDMNLNASGATHVTVTYDIDIYLLGQTGEYLLGQTGEYLVMPGTESATGVLLTAEKDDFNLNAQESL